MFDLARFLGIQAGWPGRVTVGDGPVWVICLDPRDPPPPIEGSATAWLVADRPIRIRGIPVARVFSSEAFRSTRAGARPVAREAVIHCLEAARLPPIWTAIRVGVRRFHFTFAVGASFSTGAAAACLLGCGGSMRGQAARLQRSGGFAVNLCGWDLVPPVPSLQSIRRAISSAARLASVPHAPFPSAGRTSGTRRRRIVHYVSSLGPGGTERQLVHLASTQAARGERVVVLVSRPLKGTDRHYVPNLGDAGVEVRELPRLGWALSNMVPQRELPAWARGRWPVPLRQSVEAHPARGSIIDLSEALRIESPDVLHCWLDAPNAIGGLAGLLAGVPRIVLSTRSVNPDHFPRLARTWYRASYRLLMHAPGVVAIANSRAGAIDYARWCGVSPGRFEVIPNGISLDASSLPGSIDRTSLRAAHGVPKGAFLVVGVFRFTEEKRPLDFVAAIDQLRARVPTAQAWMVGTGPELDAIRLEVERRGLADSIALLGGKADAERWLALADASLLPSRREGCPNVVLESQALGVPVVVTRGGGSPEVMVEGETGFACEVGDVDSMAERLAMLAEAPEQARAMGERGRALVSERFSVERMVAATLKAYLSAENEPRC